MPRQWSIASSPPSIRSTSTSGSGIHVRRSRFFSSTQAVAWPSLRARTYVARLPWSCCNQQSEGRRIAKPRDRLLAYFAAALSGLLLWYGLRGALYVAYKAAGSSSSGSLA